MTARRAAGALLGFALLANQLGCGSTAPAATPHQADCAGFVAPKVLSAPSVALPPTLTAAHIGLEMPGELVVARDGAVSNVHLPGAQYAFLVPFADEALRHTRFSAASIQGNPVAARVAVIVPIGLPRKARVDAVPPSLRAFVPGTESREARWQLRDSVERLALVGHVGKLEAPGATIVAVAPGGADRVLVTVPPSAQPQEIQETVKTGKFLAAAGDYRLEIRAGGSAIASTTVTIAEDYQRAVVNACEPTIVSRKIGPGN